MRQWMRRIFTCPLRPDFVDPMSRCKPKVRHFEDAFIGEQFANTGLLTFVNDVSIERQQFVDCQSVGRVQHVS